MFFFSFSWDIDVTPNTPKEEKEDPGEDAVSRVQLLKFTKLGLVLF